MRVAFIADVHVGQHMRYGGAIKAGINGRCQLVLDALEQSMVIAAKHGARDLVINGDLFDTTRPTPQILKAVADIIDRRAEIDNTIIILGNHDQQSPEEGDHALGPITYVGGVDVVEHLDVLILGRDGDQDELVIVPYRPGRASEWLPKVLAEAAQASLLSPPPSGRRVLALHLGLFERGNLPHWAKGAHDAVDVEMIRRLMKEYAIDATFAGNWHNRQVWNEPLICQCGSLAPTGFDDPGSSGHGVTIYDSKTHTIDFHEVPGPRFIKAKWPNSEMDLLGADAAIAMGCQVYLQATAPEGQGKLVDLAIAARYAKTGIHGELAGWEVRIDDTIAKTEARTAATVARSAESLEEALTGFVKLFPFADGVDRDSVLERCRGYLKE